MAGRIEHDTPTVPIGLLICRADAQSDDFGLGCIEIRHGKIEVHLLGHSLKRRQASVSMDRPVDLAPRAAPRRGRPCHPERMPILVTPVVEAGTMAEAVQPDVVVDSELHLRPWRAADAGVVVRAFSDPDIQHWHFRRYDETEALAWIAECNAQWRSERCASWAVARSRSGEVVGRAAIHTWLRDGLGEVTYWVLPEARGHGVATRAAVAATRWAHELGLHRVQLQHSTRNEASARVALKAAFVSEGIRRGANLHDDGWHDMHLYAHLATD
jgi:RimJ/RimL family protein N-acetyltransferase